MDPITIALGVARLAPMVAGWLGGDDAADKAAKVVEIAEGITGQKGPAVLDALRENPDLVLKLEDAVTERMRLDMEDRDSARKRDVAVQTLRGRNARADILAISSILGLIGLIWTLIFVQIPEGPARDVLLILSGALVTIVKDVYGFEFGSSRGSKEKDGVLAAFKK